MKYTILAAMLSLVSGWVNTQKPAKILILNGFLHVGNGQVVEKSAIGIQGDKIMLVRNSLAYSYKKEDWDTVIQAEGKHIYPGFVAPSSTIGLNEIESVRATRDFQEVGVFNPHVRTLTAFNVESKIIPTVRANGVLIVQAAPRGGRVPGTSSLMHMGGWNWEDAVIKADDGIHINWPESIQGGGWWAEPENKKRNESYEDQERELVRFFSMAKAYSGNTGEAVKDLRFEAMKELFTGEKRVYFHANEIQQLLDIIDFAKQLEVRYPVIVGGYDAHLVAQRLKDASIPVMLPRLHALPENEEDAVDLPYQLPALLQAGGVKFCLQNEGDMETMGARNIPFLAGTAMAYGLTEEQTVRSVSLSPCEIMGIGKQYGSIEEGKKATLFISKGNALDMRTNQVTGILMDGKFMDIENVQSGLYKKYSGKYAEEMKNSGK